MVKIVKNRFHTYSLKLLEGCKQCIEGRKLVLFITGVCPRKCFYCPLSEKKWMKDDIYANEWKIESTDDMLKEAELTEATGAGITGGDPLARINRVTEYIRMLKKHFGKKFHIHLYTSLNLVSEQRLKKLYDAGLDEIRVHPDIYDDRLWHRMKILKLFEWQTAIEIPAIPDAESEISKLVEFSIEKVDSINLNELEISDTNIHSLTEKGYFAKNNISYGVAGSEERAKKIIDKYGIKIPIHYCTCSLKDRLQLGSRLKRRAANVAKPFDKVTCEGILIRGVAYPAETTPSFDYEDTLKKADASLLELLNKDMNFMIKRFNIPKENIMVDDSRYRILMSASDTRRLSNKIKSMNLRPAIIHEYPTHDKFIVELEFL